MSSKRDEMVQVAFDLVAARGVAGLTFREVGLAVGLDHSTVHHYFATKQKLVAAVVEHATGRFWREQPPEPSLVRHLELIASLIENEPRLFVVLRELDLLATRDPGVAASVAEAEDGWRHALAQRMDVDPRDVAVEQVIATVRGVSLYPDRARATLGNLATTVSSCVS